MEKTEPVKEYLGATNNIHHWQTIRFAQLTIFMAITAGLLNALLGKGSPLPVFAGLSVKVAGLVITALYLVLQERTMLYWRHFVARAAELEGDLGYRQYSTRPPAGLFSSSNAMRLFFLVLALFWLGTLFFVP